MFDDKNPKQGQTPDSLPTEDNDKSQSSTQTNNKTDSEEQEEPEDMFAETDAVEQSQNQGEQTTAMEAGKINKKNPNPQKQTKDQATSSDSKSKQQPNPNKKLGADNTGNNLDKKGVGGQQQPKVEEPRTSKRIMILIGVVLVLAILGLGGWWIYASFISTDEPSQDFAGASPTTSKQTDQQQADQNESDNDNNDQKSGDNSDQQDNNTSSDSQDKQILFGEDVDTDKDQLPDQREKELGTDPKNWDTDGDGLGDGNEVLNWNTDPTNPDTDGDGYKDGEEVDNGYNPKGKGKLFQPPTSSNKKFNTSTSSGSNTTSSNNDANT